MDKKFVVYQHLNTTNGKRYIGITCQTPSQRWRKGLGYKNNPHFYRAIQKYGWDNFEHQILYSNLSQNEALKIEKELIEKYDTTNWNKGYNIIEGGGLPPMTGRKHTEESKEKNRQAHLGKKLTPEQIQAISKRSKKMWDNITPEEKEKRLYNLIHCERYKPEVGNGAKAVLCVEEEKIFTSSHAASRWLCGDSSKSSNIRACCRGKHKKVYGCHWKWYIEEKEGE